MDIIQPLREVPRKPVHCGKTAQEAATPTGVIFVCPNCNTRVG